MASITRCDVFAGAALIGGWALTGRLAAAAQPASAPAGADGPYTLAPLPYDYAALEPHIDAETMKLHHDVHHAAYVQGANQAQGELAAIRQGGGNAYLEQRAALDKLTFNLAGHVLHSVFWNNMRRDGGGDPPTGSRVDELLRRDFGSIDKWRESFSWAAMQVQGSGWGVLAWEPLSQRLTVLSVEKHQNLALPGAVPLLVVDVWEHAYYLKYRQQRAAYLRAFMNVIHWQDVEQRLRTAESAAAGPQ